MTTPKYIFLAAFLPFLLGLAIWGKPWSRPAPFAPPAPLRISAAISLRKALEQSRTLLETACARPISFNFASSGALAAQISRGAPVDLFISADRSTIDALLAQGLVDNLAIVATNQLVLIVPPDSPIHSLSDLNHPSVTRIALGEPKTVPAGRYAKQSLIHAQLWDRLDSAHHLIMAENVAQVLAYLTRGEADAAFVYRSDTLTATNKIRIAAAIPDDFHDPITYVQAIPTSAPNKPSAMLARQALLGTDIQSILSSHGFSSPPPSLPNKQPR